MLEVFGSLLPKRLFAWALAFWAALAIASPSHVANYDFRHFSADDGMTISFSRSSPPLAILQDERLSIVQSEPVAKIKLEPGARLISAGTKKAWPRLRRYAWYFARDFGSAKLRHRSLRMTQAAILQKSGRIHSPRFARVSVIDELTRLVRPVIAAQIGGRGIEAAGFAGSQQIKQIVRSLASATYYGARTEAGEVTAPVAQPIRGPMTVRQHVEMPLTAPPVPRGLPRGEDAPPVVVEGDHVSQAEPAAAHAPLQIVTPVSEIPNGTWKVARLQEPAVPPARAPSVITPKPAAPAPAQDQTLAQNSRTPDSADAKPQGIYAMDGGSNDPFTIYGQVELSGGLAATGYSTKLSIQWRTGNQTRDAAVDYSSGQFEIKVPTLAAGKVVATLVDDSGRPLGFGDYDLDGIASPGQRSIEGVDIIVGAEDTNVKGQIRSAYSVDNAFVPVTGAEVFGPAQTREDADDKGNFKLSGLNADATMLLDSYATDYWGTRVIAAGNIKAQIPLFSERMVDSFMSLVGETSDISQYGIVWGEVKHKGKPVAGVQVGISSGNAIGPIYFNELRIPDQSLKHTSSNGLYAFVKVKPGLDVVMAEYNNHELPSTVVSISPSMISYSEISFKSLELMGRVFDPVAGANLKAQISVVGASQTAKSDEGGFQLKIPSSDPVLFVEANPGPDYMISREAIPRKSAHNINLMAYRKDWISNQLQKAGLKYDANRGLLLGYVEGPRFTVRLDDAEDIQDAADAADPNILYFDENGNPDPSRLDGVAGGGVFMMTNLKPGLHTLVITSASGDMTSSRIFVSERGVLNVLSMPLRP